MSRLVFTPKWSILRNIPFHQKYIKFNLLQLGSDLNRFNPLRLSYQNLPIDTPTRFRRYQKFKVNCYQNHFEFIVSDDYRFQQNVPDERRITRYFQPIESHILNNHLLYLITQIIGLTIIHHPKPIQSLDLSVHQVRLIAGMENHHQADNAPEGIHQDGADYIVSALIFNKYNIYNDNSIIYNDNLQEIYQTQLQEGEGILQNDKVLWHDITPIQAQLGYLGYRDILGLDFKIL
jgi:hypothetical protein